MNDAELERIACEAKAESVLELLKENQRLRERVGELEGAVRILSESILFASDTGDWDRVRGAIFECMYRHNIPQVAQSKETKND